MRLPILLAAFMGLALGLPAHADDAAPPDLATIRAEQVALRDLAAKGEDPFTSMSKAGRQELVDRQTRLLQLLEDRESFDELMGPSQVEVVNLLQEINAIVNAAGDDEAFRCEYTRKTGSHRKERVCKTVAERRIESEASREAMRRWQNKGHLNPNN